MLVALAENGRFLQFTNQCNQAFGGRFQKLLALFSGGWTRAERAPARIAEGSLHSIPATQLAISYLAVH